PTPVAAAPGEAARRHAFGGRGEAAAFLDAAATAGLGELARRHRLTLNTFVQGAWALLLARRSGESDVVFGVVVSGRPAAEIAGWSGHLAALLGRMAAFPERALADLPTLTEAESQQTTVEWNDTEEGSSPPKTLHGMFLAQAERAPEAVALVFEGEWITY